MTSIYSAIFEISPNFGLIQELLLHLYFKLDLPSNGPQDISLLLLKSIKTEITGFFLDT